MSGSLCSQIPGSSREAGTQADRALCPGWGDDEEGGCGERIGASMKRNHVKHCRETTGEWGGKLWSLSVTRPLFNSWVGFLLGNWENCQCCRRTAERNCLFCCITGMGWTTAAPGEQLGDNLHPIYMQHLTLNWAWSLVGHLEHDGGGGKMTRLSLSCELQIMCDCFHLAEKYKNSSSTAGLLNTRLSL